MRWWDSEKRIKGDGNIRHPADASQWQKFDDKHKDFAKDPRNVRFALSTDGMNPFGERKSTHSTWPVVMSMFNLPTWLCQKRKFLFLCILIEGPKHPGIDIDVFLQPLLEEMANLWNNGIKIMDGFTKQEFTLRAMIFVTINDYQALFVLSGQVKGKTACTVCLDDETAWQYLDGTRKGVYLRYRCFLEEGHKYRGKKFHQFFGGDAVIGPAPAKPDGHTVFQMVKDIEVEYGKMTKDGKMKNRDKAPKVGVPFKKQSIFFKYLPYWEDLEVRHAIDGMHMKKNVFGNIIGLLLDTRDNLKARQDLVAMNIRDDLHPIDVGNGRYELPPASYNLTLAEKRGVCESLRGIRVPSRYSSNIKKLVSVKELSFTGYNCHDCHVMLTVFLAIAIRAIKPVYVKMVITRLCYFFDRVSQKVIAKDELDELQDFMRETMVQLEMCFPPHFFDVTEHLMIHIVDQIRTLGPLYLHEMWAYERFLSILNRYVLNRANPEGSMIEGYSTEEVIECCLAYLKDNLGIGLPQSLHQGRLDGIGIAGRKTFIDKDMNDIKLAHYSVMQCLTLMEPFIQRHLDVVRAESHGRSPDWIMKEHKRRFVEWLMEQEIPDGETIEERTIKRLASGPSAQVITWQGYDINGYIFYTAKKDNKSVSQNSGVRTQAQDGNSGQTITYYGIIDDIWELDYGDNIRFPVFWCKWVKHPRGVEVDNFGLTIVDLQNIGYKDDPWILASHVAQVFYVIDPSKKQKHIVIPGKQNIIGVDGVEDVEQYNQFEEMNLFQDLPHKIQHVEASIKKGEMPWARNDGEPRIVNG